MPLSEEQRMALGRDIEFGENARVALKEVVMPYFEAKEQQLFETFRNWPLSDEQGLMKIRMQLQVLDVMFRELHEAVEFGKISFTQLMSEEKENEPTS